MSTCASCKYVYIAKADEQPACRRFPPQTHFLVVLRHAQTSVMLKGGGQMVPQEEQRSAFPPVQADWTCGEWASKVVQ